MQQTSAKAAFPPEVTQLRPNKFRPILYRIESIEELDGHYVMDVRPSNVGKPLPMALPIDRMGKKPLEVGDIIDYEYSQERGQKRVLPIAGKNRLIIDDYEAFSPNVVNAKAWKNIRDAKRRKATRP